MKKFKNKILTLLLLTFAFFVVHDYIIIDFHEDAKYEINCKKIDTVDMQSKVHDTIHNIFNFHFEEFTFTDSKFLDTPPQSIIQSLSSSTNPVPQRPPLS